MNDAVGNFLGSYTWIDNVLLDGMDYFAGLFYFFNHWAYRIAAWVMLVGLLINAIKLLFGAEAIKKVAIGTLGKLLVFGLLFFSYNSIVATVANTALSWGSNSGGGRGTVTANLITLMEQTKADLAIAQELSAIENPKERETKLKSMKKEYRAQKAMGRGTKNRLVNDLVSSDGVANYRNQANLYKDVDEVIDFQEKTLKTLEGILVPTKVKDKNGNLVDTYFLATTLIDKKGNPTYYVSPAAFLKVSFLTGELMWRRQADYVEIKYNEALEDAEERTKGDWVKFPALEAMLETYTMSTFFNFILCFICKIAIFICAIMILIQYIMTFFEYAIVTSIVVFYIPFYLADATKQITAKLFPIFWNFFIKLMVITICMWFSLYIYINIGSDQMGAGVPFDAMSFLTTMFSILLSFVVTQSSPKISQTIISGNPELSMGEFLMAAGTMWGAQKAARGVAGGVAKTVARPAGQAVGEGRARAAQFKQKTKDAGGGRFSQAGAAITGGVLGGVAGGAKGIGKEIGNLGGTLLFTEQSSQTAGVRFRRGVADGAASVFGSQSDSKEKTQFKVSKKSENKTASTNNVTKTNNTKFEGESTKTANVHKPKGYATKFNDASVNKTESPHKSSDKNQGENK